MKIINKINEKIEQNEPFFSLEFFPPKSKEQWPSFFNVVNKLKKLSPLFASVTYGAGGSTQENTLDITAELKKEGILPLTHLTCVGATSEVLIEYLKRLKDSGATNILALRGDAPQNQEGFTWGNGEFIFAKDLASFVKINFPEFGIAAAAYPTPHPESPSFDQDRKFTAEKLSACDFAVTQVFFDTREYFEYVNQMKNLGIHKPILPGVLPIQSFESLKRVLSLSGCTIPAKLYLSFEKANEEGGAEAVREAGLVFAKEQIQRLIEGGAPGVHLYTLNRSEACLKLAIALGVI